MAPDFAQHNRTEIPVEGIGHLLRGEGIDVLSLADDGVAYGISLSFDYDADQGQLYLVFLRPGESSRKAEFAEWTTCASFIIRNASSRGQRENIVVDGELHQVGDGDWDHVHDALEGNAQYPTLFSETESTQDVFS